MAYKMKVWKLPMAAPQARGKALINLLPLETDENITTIMPLPEDETSWSSLDVMFVTRSGNVRRNKLSDFVEVRQNGKIAMKLDEGDQIHRVDICTENDDVLMTTAAGKAIRFPVTDVRVFSGRTSTGVRGIRLDKDDRLISMAILHHVEASPAERAEYVRQANAIRRAATGEPDVLEEETSPDAEVTERAELTPERYAELGAYEQFILTISQNGYGKRSSAYEYRVSGRGGKGIISMTVNDRNGPLVASFPIDESGQIMLVTDGGQLIRVRVEDISIIGRSTQGVTVFNTADSERVVYVEGIPEEEEGEDDPDGDADGDAEGGDETPKPDETPDL
jgi:DNA gyrase subunit A